MIQPKAALCPVVATGEICESTAMPIPTPPAEVQEQRPCQLMDFGSLLNKDPGLAWRQHEGFTFAQIEFCKLLRAQVRLNQVFLARA